ncbi:YadA C-terminal domain-containing protein [Vibrio sp. SBT000027]|uniref:YadA C-terminal domain-containing protein n=1 Tax=Vibrio sp. SBT000027 TaxID=1803384 RepID=UPI000EF48F67|nr:YadA C-terminal domain-containing protein [Vibrio sp. SBT000027]RLQ16154.1 hypothetical protein AYK60_13465 [Vibrio sp. SBT000027]
MKKTILATLIAATSFNALAIDTNPVLPPQGLPSVDPIDVVIDPILPIIELPKHLSEADKAVLGTVISAKAVDHVNNKVSGWDGDAWLTEINARANTHGYGVEVQGDDLVFTKVNTDGTNENVTINKNDFHTKVDNRVKELSAQRDANQAARDEKLEIKLPIEDSEPTPLPDVRPPQEEMPVVGIDPERVQEAVQQLVESGNNLNESGRAAAQQAAQQQAQIDEIYAQGQQNTSDIATLFNEVDRLDTRIDQTQALNAATVNARPMVTNGQTAFGAGVGYAGSEAAISVGVAHSFVDTGWSASGTLAASSDDVVIGAGTQYAF